MKTIGINIKRLAKDHSKKYSLFKITHSKNSFSNRNINLTPLTQKVQNYMLTETFCDLKDVRMLNKTNKKNFSNYNKKLDDASNGIVNENETKNQEKSNTQSQDTNISNTEGKTVKDDAKPVNTFIKTRLEDRFVDKTEFIREVLGLYRTNISMICGPRRSGKSTNLRMLELFFEIDPDQKLGKINPETHYARKYFAGTNIYENQPILFNEHFGRYPVIYFDFSTIEFNNPIEFEESLRDAVEDIKEKYDYLLQANDVSNEYKKACALIQKKGIQKSIKFLSRLCSILTTYYKRSPIILIDECDEPIRKTVETCETLQDYKKISKTYASFCLSLLKANEHKDLCVLTGITRLSRSNIFSPNNITAYISIDGRFAKYYSFTEEEVKNLVDKLEYTKGEREVILTKLKSMYNGYTIGNEVIYNCFSICEALNDIKGLYNRKIKIDIESLNDVLKCYWYDTYKLDSIDGIFKYWISHKILNDLLTNEYIGSSLNYMTDAMNEVKAFKFLYDLDLKKYYSKNDKIVKDFGEVFISYMVTLGYLNANKISGKEMYKVSIPNEEIRISLKKLQDDIKKQNVNNSEITYDEIFESVEDLFKVDDNSVKENVENAFDQLGCFLCYDFSPLYQLKKKKTPSIIYSEKNEMAFMQFLIFWMPREECYVNGWDKVVSEKRRPNIYSIKKDQKIAITIEVKFESTAKIAYDQTLKYCEDIIKKYIIEPEPNDKLNIDQFLRIGVNFSFAKDHIPTINVEYSLDKVKESALVESDRKFEFNFNGIEKIK